MTGLAQLALAEVKLGRRLREITVGHVVRWPISMLDDGIPFLRS